ncbi:unnamed protein product [Bursaphelenchus okinawaensis]|uniref:Uncharacterized protein n=1 Tax=Bursaphelenchus okinawaensis TaxID=465554 RepID=A0A811KSL4_9BILA|nr:unnamed protein product [Bursaphelenchus okinawaensis]CAG9110538.1 unnamed protein product [Bursaphelenchus okinawaensis]
MQSKLFVVSEGAKQNAFKAYGKMMEKLSVGKGSSIRITLYDHVSVLAICFNKQQQNDTPCCTIFTANVFKTPIIHLNIMATKNFVVLRDGEGAKHAIRAYNRVTSLFQNLKVGCEVRLYGHDHLY